MTVLAVTPNTFELYGSNESIDGPYELIVAGSSGLTSFRKKHGHVIRLMKTEIMFDNDVDVQTLPTAVSRLCVTTAMVAVCRSLKWN